MISEKYQTIEQVQALVAKDLRAEIQAQMLTLQADNSLFEVGASLPVALPKVTSIEDLKRLQFMQFNMPAIQAGLYDIQTFQEVKGSKNSDIDADYKSKKQYFRIQGERYTLPPQYKHFVYPPTNDAGKYEDVLPHIIINRSTFPWEREASVQEQTPKSATPNTPANKPGWLALLVLTEDEQGKIPLKKMTLKEAGFDFESDAPEDKKLDFSFLEINKDNADLVQSILPAPIDIQYLAHSLITKQPTTKKAAIEEMAVILSNRLPTPGKKHHVHLISTEKDVYGDLVDDFGWNTTTWDNIKAGTKKKYLVSLYNWSFTCKESGALGFREILEKQVNIGPFQMYNVDLMNVTKPEKNDGKLAPYLKRGFVPMPHYLRKGEKTISWYHGPLVPIFNQWEHGIDVKYSTSSDDYLLYDKTSGLLDVSYAAAWLLGRNLTLQNKVVAKQLYFWRKSAEQWAKKKLLGINNHLIKAFNLLEAPSNEMPKAIKKWVEELMCLEHIPFNYLISHPTMLPSEALRFVRLDYNWMAALLDGVLSVGMDTTSLKKKVIDYKKDYNKDFEPMTGFLLRSKVVKDYPKLDYEALYKLSDGNDISNSKRLPVNSLKLAFDIQLCLYTPDSSFLKGAEKFVKTIAISSKPRDRHFGLFIDNNPESKPAKQSKIYNKRLRHDNGQDIEEQGKFIEDSLFQLKKGNEPDDLINDKYLISFDKLTQKMDKVVKAKKLEQEVKGKIQYNVANFAFHMMEGTPRVLLFQAQENIDFLPINSTIEATAKFLDTEIELKSEDGEKTYTLKEAPVEYEKNKVWGHLEDYFPVPVSYFSFFPEKLYLEDLIYTVASKQLEIAFKINSVGEPYKYLFQFSPDMKIDMGTDTLKLIIENEGQLTFI